MAWHTSTRAQRLPPNWPVLRADTIRRARGRCEAKRHHPQCDGTGTEVDHITPGDDHRPTNLQALSTACHKAKTARETAARNSRYARMRKRSETHPGAI